MPPFLCTVCVLVLGLLSGFVGCEPKPAPPVAGPALRPDEKALLGDALEEFGGKFSYRMPRGWSAQKLADSPYRAAVGSAESGYVPNIRVSRHPAPLNFDLYLGEARKELERQVQGGSIEEDSPFVTSEGLKGRRWIVHTVQGGERIWHAHYLFPGPIEDKLVVTVSAPQTQAKKIAAAADACLKTLKVR